MDKEISNVLLRMFELSNKKKLPTSNRNLHNGFDNLRTLKLSNMMSVVYMNFVGLIKQNVFLYYLVQFSQ